VKTLRFALTAGAVLLGACAGPRHPQDGSGATPVGAPRPAVDPRVLELAFPAGNDGAEPPPVRLPERLTLPASYRLMLLDGHLTLVRESDPRALAPDPASLRVVTGEIARGELAYQPGLLPQELAAEVAANRESSARMDNALAAVMRRSRELSAQALELEAQGRRLAELLAAAEARSRVLEPEKGAAPATEVPAAPVPGGSP